MSFKEQYPGFQKYITSHISDISLNGFLWRGPARLIIVLSCIFFSSLINNSQAQVLVQLEIYDNPKGIKFGPGSTLSYKTTTMENWKTEKIQSINYETQIIVFTSGFEHLDNIIKVRRYKPWVRQLGLKLMQFSAAWFLYGGISELINDDFSFGWDHATIGGGAFVTGFVMYKLAAVSTYNVKGGKDRLRIIDISWPDPDELYKKG